MDPYTAAAISSGANNLVGTLLGYSSQKSTNKANLKLAEYQYSKALEMWNRQNEYNLPKNQMSRLTDAGLNPNLVYGNGTVQGLTSAPAPQYHAPTLQAYTNFGSLGAEQAVTTYMQLKQSDAAINKTNAETQKLLKELPLVEMEKSLKELDIAKRGILNSISEKERDHWEQTYNMTLAEMQSRIDRNRSEIPVNAAKEKNYNKDTELKEAQRKTEEKRPALVEAQTKTEEKRPALIQAQTRTEEVRPSLIMSQISQNYASVQKVLSDIKRNEHLNNLTDEQIELASAEIAVAATKNAGQLQENEIRGILLKYGIDLKDHGPTGLIQKQMYNNVRLWEESQRQKMRKN